MTLMKMTPQGELPMTKDEEVAFLADQAAANAPTAASLAAHRYAVCNGGMTAGGVPIKTDSESRADLTAAFIMATANPSYSVKWKAADGNFYPLNAAAIIAIANAVAAFVQKCFDSEASVSANLSQYSTMADANAAFDAAMAA